MRSKRVWFIGVFLFLSAYVFAGQLPFVIRSFYEDWNLIALNSSKEVQDKYWNYLAKADFGGLRIQELSQKDILITKSMINIYKNYPMNTNMCPVSNSILFMKGYKTSNNDYIVTLTRAFINKRTSENDGNIIEPDDVIGKDGNLSTMGEFTHIWEYRDGEYILKPGLGVLIH